MKTLTIALVTAALALPVAAQAQNRETLRQDQAQVQKDRADMRADRAEGRHRMARDDRRDLRNDQKAWRGDWRNWRREHPNAYKMRAYVGPRGFTYRPLRVGHALPGAYYTQRYWVANPVELRLPHPRYGYERWVRYGNDVALVNTRNGRILEVYSNFFLR
ncbi:MAG: RcnB family protein [Sphingomonadaceae bacterium]